MKNFPLKLLLSFVSFVIGLVMVIVIVVPSYDAGEKVIKKYISAINSENAEKMQKYELSASDYLGGLVNDEILETFDTEDSKEEQITRKYLLENGAIASRVPDEALEVTKIKLLGCSNRQSQEELGISFLSYDILLEVEYVVEEDGEELNQTIYYGDTVNLANGNSGYKIAG